MWLVDRIGERAVKDMEIQSQLRGAGMKEWDFDFIAQEYREKCKALAWKKPPIGP
jgi:hypothetical protein